MREVTAESMMGGYLSVILKITPAEALWSRRSSKAQLYMLMVEISGSGSTRL